MTEVPASDWNLGIGLTVGGWSPGLIGLGGGRALYSTSGISVERRVAGPLWVRVGGGVSFDRTSLGEASSRHLGGYGGAGLRLDVLRLGLVQASAYGDVLASGSRSTFEAPDGSQGYRTLGVAGVAGVAGEVELTSVVALRAEVDLLSGGWSRIRQDEDQTGDSTQFGLRVIPSLQLRLRL